MICPSCSQKISVNDRFCPYCGARMLDYNTTMPSYDEAYKKFVFSEGNKENTQQENNKAENLEELDIKVRAALDKRNKESMTRSDLELEELTNVREIYCENCGERLVLGMNSCPKCGNKLPYGDKDIKGKVFRDYLLLVLILAFTVTIGTFVYGKFTKSKAQAVPPSLPNSLPGGEEIGSTYYYDEGGPIIFPGNQDEDDNGIEDEAEEVEIEELEIEEPGVDEPEDIDE